MATPRADVDDVIALTGTSMDSGVVQLLVDDAALWVDNYLVGVCKGLADSKIEPIERYLAAAFVVASDESGGQLIESQRGDIRDRYAERAADSEPGAAFLRRASAFEPCGIIAEQFLGEPRAKYAVGPGYRRR